MQNSSVKQISFYLYIFGIFLLAAALPWSNFLMSNAEIILLISWIIGGDLIEKFKNFFKNKTALIISSVFLMHIIGLAYTSDFSYGMEDVRKKIPLLLLPLIFSTSPSLAKEMFEKILSLFIISVVAATFFCFYVLLGYTTKLILFPQQASIFISHIRFGLLISLSVFFLGYFFIKKNKFLFKIIIPLIIIWLILFLIMMESFTGLVCIGVVTILLYIYFIVKTKKLFIKLLLSLPLIIACLFIGILIFSSIKINTDGRKIDKNSFSLVTRNGNPYSNDTVNTETENGNFIWRNVCEKELSNEWNKKSKLDYNGKDLKGNDIKYTLIRFLTSKGIAKDSEGINILSKKEIEAIEKGVPNTDYMGVFNPTARLRKISWELNLYFGGGNPSGHSVVQRFEFWKAAIGIIKENLLFGVGTGDVEIAFKEQYEKMNSPLTQEYRLRSHNQFLSIGIAFGIIGIIWFLISLFYPLIAKMKFKDYFYITFFVIAFLSMITEDTLESQAGVTFFAFFNSLLLFTRPKE